jgi:hypothetical protein
MKTKVNSRADPDRLQLLDELDKLEDSLKSVARQLEGKPGWVELDTCLTRLKRLRTLMESQDTSRIDWLQTTRIIVCLTDFIVRLWS